MKFNLYLPGELGAEAKGAELPLSRLLRSAVEDELTRRNAMDGALKDPQTYEVEIDGRDGAYTGRITGRLIAEADTAAVYLTTDERVIVYDGERRDYWTAENPADELREFFGRDVEAYAQAMAALGIRPVIDL